MDCEKKPPDRAICPECGSEETKVRNTYRARTTDGVRRVHLCKSCGHRWSIWSGQQPDQYSHPGCIKHGNTLTEEQIREILTDRNVSHIAMARRLGKSRSAVQRVRAGTMYRQIAPELPRWTRSSRMSCTNCCHHNGSRCMMSIPEYETDGPSFAMECAVFEPVESAESATTSQAA